MQALRETFREDVVMVEAQQKSFDTDPTAIQIDVSADQPTIQARNLVSRMIEEESAGA